LRKKSEVAIGQGAENDALAKDHLFRPATSGERKEFFLLIFCFVVRKLNEANS